MEDAITYAYYEIYEHPGKLIKDPYIKEVFMEMKDMNKYNGKTIEDILEEKNIDLRKSGKFIDSYAARIKQ